MLGGRCVGLLNVTERVRVGTALSPQHEATRPWPGDLPNPGLAAGSQAQRAAGPLPFRPVHAPGSPLPFHTT